MKPPRIKTFLGCLLFFNLASASDELPAELITYIESLDISYMLIERKDLHPKFLDKPRKGDTRLVGDFNGDSQIDYALLLKNRNTYVSLIVFIGGEDGFSHHILDDNNYSQYFDENKIAEALYPEDGDDVIGPYETLKLEHLASYSSAGRGAYYIWRDNKFYKFVTWD